MSGTPPEDNIPTESTENENERLHGVLKRAMGTGEKVPIEHIGPYRVLGEIGRGGMGAVYKATNEREGGRKVVAIKLIRKGMDSDDVIGRFELERRVLGALDHPNIARLFDADTTEDDRPYFVMEYISGQPIDEYCDQNRSSIAKRLELFRKVCSAVHHAHQNLIVHRDLKPANILVTASGEPKLLDFGIAKLLNPELARVEAITRTHFRVMTPEYASPEQVRGGSVNVQSDVYSLGVLLYELLCGHRPYQFEKRLQEEIVRIVCESEPDRPSTALTHELSRRRADGTTESISPSTVAQRRNDRLESLRRHLTGDLDDIVLMAMEKAPDRRYASAEQFADDIQRYLSGHTVRARRTSARAMYSARKFVRRHRTAVAATLTAAALLLASGTVTALQWKNASSANAQAAIAAEELASEYQSRLEAEETARAAERNELISSRFSGALWENASRLLSFSFTPTEREEFWSSIQEQFRGLSDLYGSDNPIVLRERARALMETADSLGGIRAANRGEFQAALEAYQLAQNDLLALYQKDRNNPALWTDALNAQLATADALRRLNHSQEAYEAYQNAVTIADAYNPPREDLAALRKQSQPRFSLGQIAVTTGRFELAEQTFLSEIEARRERLTEHPDNINVIRDLSVALYNLGDMHRNLGDTDSAEPYLEESLSLRQTLLARNPKHPTLRRDMVLGLYATAIIDQLQNRHENAQQKRIEADTLLTGLMQELPDSARLPALRASGLLETAESMVRSGQHTQALPLVAEIQTSIDALSSITATHPSLGELRARLRLLNAEFAAHNNDSALAIEQLTLARDQLTLIAAMDQASVFAKYRLAEAWFGLAQAHAAAALKESDSTNHTAAAQAAYTEAMNIHGALPAKFMELQHDRAQRTARALTP